ncbi:MAG: hypothetical protein Q8P13_03135 [bacterium]|nr:hypothetical protein [bacterium]
MHDPKVIDLRLYRIFGLSSLEEVLQYSRESTLVLDEIPSIQRRLAEVSVHLGFSPPVKTVAELLERLCEETDSQGMSAKERALARMLSEVEFQRRRRSFSIVRETD